MKTIQDRRNTILNYISIVEGRLIKAQQKASLAEDELILAENMVKALQRRSGGDVQRENNSGIQQANDEIRRSEQSKEDSVDFIEQQVVREFTVKIVKLACEKARTKLREKAKIREFRNMVMNDQIEKYKIATKKKMAARKTK